MKLGVKLPQLLRGKFRVIVHSENFVEEVVVEKYFPGVRYEPVFLGNAVPQSRERTAKLEDASFFTRGSLQNSGARPPKASSPRRGKDWDQPPECSNAGDISKESKKNVNDETHLDSRPKYKTKQTWATLLATRTTCNSRC